MDPNSDLLRENGQVMVELPLPVFDAQVCPVVLGDVDLVGLFGVQQLLLLGQVALKEELVDRHGGLVQLDNLNIIVVKKRGSYKDVSYRTVSEVKDNLGVGQFLWRVPGRGGSPKDFWITLLILPPGSVFSLSFPTDTAFLMVLLCTLYYIPWGFT